MQFLNKEVKPSCYSKLHILTKKLNHFLAVNSTDLIHQNFGKFCREYEPGNPSSSIVSSATNQESWTNALNQLQFDSLPQLLQQINALPKLLKLSELQDDISGSIHESILKIQSKLEENLDQIQSISASIKEGPIGSASSTDDKHFEKIKEFRRAGVSIKLMFLGDDLGEVFSFGARTMEELEESSQAKSGSPPICPWRVYYQELTVTATKGIDKLMKWITRHEFINLQEDWPLRLSTYDSGIDRLNQFINQTINPPKPKDGKELSVNLKNLKKKAILLVQLFITVIKLSRLFFTKLAKEGLNKTPLKPFIDMNSNQLSKLSESPINIGSNLYGIVKNIESRACDKTYITQAINQIVQSFDSNLLLVFLYVIPLVPNSLSSPNCLYNSLLTWYNLFSSATENFICAAKSYPAPSLQK
jgi:hypothetical protein